ncbi:hypothetical protein D3C87_1683240 [compost metagenome]
MGDVLVLEAAHHVDDGVHLADVGEELVAKTLALARAAHQPRDVHELDGGRDDGRGLDDALQHAEALVGDRHDADVGVDGAERIVGRHGSGASQGVEEGRLPDVRKADDTGA